MKTYLAMYSFLISLFLGTALPSASSAGDFDYSLYDQMLKKYVDKNGRVNYYRWIKKDKHKFVQYIEGLNAAKLSGMTEDEEFAFWINAYNACTIYGVIKRYPVETIRPSFLWIPNQSFFNESVYNIAGKTYSLNDIEHSILRHRFKDPRLHFAIVCASISCPDLLDRAYQAASLDQTLEQRARRFINNSTKNYIDDDEKTIYLSKIFDWFEEDFEHESGSVLNFVKGYFDHPDVTLLSDFEVEHLDYNWNLNEQ